MKKVLAGVGLVVGALLAGSAFAQGALPVSELFAGIHRIEAEVAATPDARAVGLMRRTSMPPHRGMLFIFDNEGTHCMWMRNTFIPLSVAFLDSSGTVINIEDMLPQTENNHCAKREARYALEMNKGWFGVRGVTAGITISGIERITTKR